MGLIGELVGTYHGTLRVREGREAELSPLERRKLAKDSLDVVLEIYADGTYCHNGSARGKVRLDGKILHFSPTTFGGKTKEEMIENAEAMGRAFGLGWLFEPFRMCLEGNTFQMGDPNALIYTEYRRS